MEMQSRGSDELLKEALRSGPRPIDDRMIEYLARKIRTIDVNDILVKGTPRPDWLKAVLLPGDARRPGPWPVSCSRTCTARTRPFRSRSAS